MSSYRYQYVVSGKLHTFTNSNKDILLSEVTDHLKKTNINYSLDNIIKSIDRQSKTVKVTNKITLASAFSGAKAILRLVKGNSASNQEIVRRADICNQCPLMTSTSGCSACGAAGKAARLANDIRSTKGSQIPIPKELASKYCSICQCSIPAMILTKYVDFYEEKESINKTRPDFCWLKRTSVNFTQE